MYLTGKLWPVSLFPDALCLKLSPYDGKGNYKRKLLPISHQEIEPAHVICPTSFICGTLDCQPRCLVQSTQECDIPMVALIKGTQYTKMFLCLQENVQSVKHYMQLIMNDFGIHQLFKIT
jgi:hypothetical protein